MPGIAVVCDVGVIADFSGQAARPRRHRRASPTTATPGMVLPYQYEDSGIGSPCPQPCPFDPISPHLELECLTLGSQWRRRATDTRLLPAGRLQPARPAGVRGGAARVRRLPDRRRLEHRRRQLRGHPRPRHEVPVGRAQAGEEPSSVYEVSNITWL